MASAAIRFDMDDLALNLALTSPGHTLDPNLDPTYGIIMDRILNVLDHYRFKASFYIIGSNLQQERARKIVRQLHQDGHEIGNHTHTHPYDLRKESVEKFEEELFSFEKECAITGIPRPIGFSAPGWNISSKHMDILIKHGYHYDCSFFPSFFKAAASFQLWCFSRFRSDMWMIRREDLIRPFTGKLPRIYRSSAGSLYLIPFPCITFLRIPIYHTLFLMLEKPRLLQKVLRYHLRTGRPLFYLFHPMDFLDPEEDLKKSGVSAHLIPRGVLPLKKRLHLIRLVLDFIAEHHEICKVNDYVQQLQASKVQSDAAVETF